MKILLRSNTVEINTKIEGALNIKMAYGCVSKTYSCVYKKMSYRERPKRKEVMYDLLD